MNTWLPPICRGKIRTTSGRLLLAAVAMFLFDWPMFGGIAGGIVAHHFGQLLALIALLLLSPRRWVALILTLPAACLLMPWGKEYADSFAWGCDLAAAFIPLWVGAFIAYPRPRRVWRREAEPEE